MEIRGIWAVYDRTDIPTCPCCERGLPTSNLCCDLHLQVVAGVKRANRFGTLVTVGRQTLTARCTTRLCFCGTAVAVNTETPGERHYSFRCVRCECYRPSLAKDGRCTCCIVGLVDPWSFQSSLSEAQGLRMGPSQEAVLDGLLHGLLTGAPGLTIPEPEGR